MRKWHLSPFEAALVMVFVIVVTWVGARHWFLVPRFVAVFDEDLPILFEKRFGRHHYSMDIEEWIIRDFIDDRREGAFLDVGSWDPIRGSNTYRLEHDFGWSGVAVDAIEEFGSRYSVERPRTRFVVAFVGDQDTGEATLHLPKILSPIASGSREFVDRFGQEAAPRQVRRRTLDSILEEQGVTSIDLLSMDIELGEPAALRGFSIGTYRPALVCIEAHG